MYGVVRVKGDLDLKKPGLRWDKEPGRVVAISGFGRTSAIGAISGFDNQEHWVKLPGATEGQQPGEGVEYSAVLQHEWIGGIHAVDEKKRGPDFWVPVHFAAGLLQGDLQPNRMHKRIRKGPVKYWILVRIHWTSCEVICRSIRKRSTYRR